MTGSQQRGCSWSSSRELRAVPDLHDRVAAGGQRRESVHRFRVDLAVGELLHDHQTTRPDRGEQTPLKTESGPLVGGATDGVHKGAAHLGKVPPGGEGATALEGRNRAFELATLKARLDAYVREEEYEKAAKVRDDIRKLKAEMEKAEKTRSKKRKGGRGKKSG